MALEDIVSVAITAATATPTRANFGTTLIAAQKVPAGFTNRVRTYNDLAGMVSDGFAVTDPAYKAAAAVFAANPRPRKVKIGRRALPTTQSIKLKCLSATSGDKYAITFYNPGAATAIPITRTVPGSSSTTAEATAIAALIDALTGVSASAVGADITVTAQGGAGLLVDFSDWTSNFEVRDASADPGIATDLAAILLEDSDWYGLILDSSSEAESNAAAAWAESNKKLHGVTSSDTLILDNATTTDIASDLKAASYAFSYILYSGKRLLSYSAAAWQGNRFPDTPGSDTWKFKTLAGVTVDALTATQRANALAKNCNVYTSVAGISMTEEGKTASGEFVDVRRFIDWLTSEMKTRIFAKLANSRKIPYTDAGVDTVVSIVEGCLRDGINAGGLASSPAPVVTAPKVADVDTLAKAARLLPDITFTATLAGAIHAVEISGTVSV